MCYFHLNNKIPTFLHFLPIFFYTIFSYDYYYDIWYKVRPIWLNLTVHICKYWLNPLYFIRPHEFADAALPLELLCLSFDRRGILELKRIQLGGENHGEPKRVDPYSFRVINNMYISSRNDKHK